MNFLSNDWWAWLWTTYSMTIIAVPTVATFILKLWAIITPNTKSDQIIELIQSFVKKEK